MLWVTNISEETQENDLRELFGVFSGVAGVYAERDTRRPALATRYMDKVTIISFSVFIEVVSRLIFTLAPRSLNRSTLRTSAGRQMSGLRRL